MSRAAWKNENQKIFGEEKKGSRLIGRFAAYWEENSADIIGGMMALNGSANGYKTYLMLRK